MPAVGTATTPDLSEMTPMVMVVSVTPFSVAPRAGLARPHAAFSVPTIDASATAVGDVVCVLVPSASPPAGGGPLSRVPQPELHRIAATRSTVIRSLNPSPSCRRAR